LDVYKRFGFRGLKNLTGVGVMGIACRKAPVTAWECGVAYGQTSAVSIEHLLRFKTFAFEVGLVDTGDY
jgi:hypothetical protein